MFLQLGKLLDVARSLCNSEHLYIPRRLEVCSSNLSDGVYDKVTISSITGVVLSADFGVHLNKLPLP